MAAPNSVLTSIINSGTETKAATTSAASLLGNPASSNRVYKIDSMVATNITDAPRDVTVTIVRTVNSAVPPTSSSGTFNLLRTASLPPYTFIPVISRDTQLFLTEGDRLEISASSNSAVNVTVSYTIIG